MLSPSFSWPVLAFHALFRPRRLVSQILRFHPRNEIRVMLAIAVGAG